MGKIPFPILNNVNSNDRKVGRRMLNVRKIHHSIRNAKGKDLICTAV